MVGGIFGGGMEMGLEKGERCRFGRYEPSPAFFYHG